MQLPLAWIDERLGTASFARKTMRKVFPDHWSFLLGEIALFFFIILVVTGTYLAMFFVPASGIVIYHGPYTQLDGRSMSEAYASVMRLSFQVRFGLVMRQMHHWAALLFVAAIVAHLFRIFFTGAFRKPRELNYIIGILLLLVAMIEGFTGYSLPDDLLSGTGLRIAYSVVLSIPVIGSWLAFFIFGGVYPTNQLIPRFFIIHVFILPAVLLGLISLHLTFVVLQKHTQYRERGRTERNVVGKYLWPEQAFKSTGLFFLVAALDALFAGLIQINPIWSYGPYNATEVSSPAQPDWYIGWLDGLLRLGGPWLIKIDGYYWSQIFWPGIFFPGVAFTLMMAWPFIEEHFITKDHFEHHLLDRPRDNPVRTGIGAAAIALFFIDLLEGGNDVIGVLLQVPIETLTVIFQVSFFVLPVITYIVTYKICWGLKRGEIDPAAPTAGERLSRNDEGGYNTTPLDPPAALNK